MYIDVKGSPIHDDAYFDAYRKWAEEKLLIEPEVVNKLHYRCHNTAPTEIRHQIKNLLAGLEFYEKLFKVIDDVIQNA